MGRKSKTPSPWKAERLDHVRRALTFHVPPPREAEPQVDAEAARTERRQQVRFGPARPP